MSEIRDGQEPAVLAWARLHRAGRRMLEHAQAALRAAELPPLSWYDILLELRWAPDGRLRQFEVGERVLLPKHNLSRLLDRLEHEKLVRRLPCTEDRRGAHVEITPGGRQLLRRMWPVYRRAIHEAMESRLEERQIHQLAKLLAALDTAPPGERG